VTRDEATRYATAKFYMTIYGRMLCAIQSGSQMIGENITIMGKNGEETFHSLQEAIRVKCGIESINGKHVIAPVTGELLEELQQFIDKELALQSIPKLIPLPVIPLHKRQR